MTVREQARERDWVAASLLLIDEDPRPVRDLPADPGTYTASAAVGCVRGALQGGGMRGGLADTSRRSVDARSAR